MPGNVVPCNKPNFSLVVGHFCELELTKPCPRKKKIIHIVSWVGFMDSETLSFKKVHSEEKEKSQIFITFLVCSIL